MVEMTRQQEIQALLYAREEVRNNNPYICIHVRYWICTHLKVNPKQMYCKLLKEIFEIIDGEPTVETWLQTTSRQFTNQIRIAIIDTLLARRGVIIP